MNKPGVCVLGMHRSGTSCLAGSLELAGLQVGEVVQVAPFNRKGNREHLGIRAVNDAVLATSGGAWNQPPPAVRWTTAQSLERDEIIGSLASLPGRCWGFKDPRTVLTLPFWLEAVPDLRIVATYRHPLAVARSLAARDGMPLDGGLQLWLTYNELVLSWLGRRGGPLVSFDAPGPEYLDAVAAVTRWLDLEPADPAAGRESVFFTEELRHEAGGGAAGQQPLPAEVDRLYRRLDDYHRTWLHERAITA